MSQNFFEINNSEVYTHLRLHIYPDGGVARFRVYGEIFKNWSSVSENEVIDLVAAINGGGVETTTTTAAPTTTTTTAA